MNRYMVDGRDVVDGMTGERAPHLSSANAATTAVWLNSGTGHRDDYVWIAS